MRESGESIWDERPCGEIDWDDKPCGENDGGYERWRETAELPPQKIIKHGEDLYVDVPGWERAGVIIERDPEDASVEHHYQQWSFGS